MAVLTPDYERMQNSGIKDFDTTKQYQGYFKNQDIDSAQGLITEGNNYLVMDADKLNDLCDTINYMQQIWADNKDEFADKYFRLVEEPTTYDTSKTYNVGDLAIYSDNPYICITDTTTGTWDSSKWFRIGNDDVGLDFIGEATEPIRDNQLAIEPNKVPVWKCSTSGYDYDCGRTYPNIRYLTSNDAPYTGEIYMTNWNGGGS